MKNFEIKHKIFLIIIGFAATLVLGVYFLIVPLINDIKYKSDQVQASLIDQKIEQEKFENLPSLEEHWNEIESHKDSLEVVLRPESELGFIKNVEAIAEQTSNMVTLEIGDYADPKEIAKIKKTNKKNSEKGILDEVAYTNFFPIQINIKGNYQNMVNFVHRMENSHFYANIISIESKKEIMTGEGARADVFSSSESDEDKKNQEIINTDINAIVYTKK